MSSIDTAGTGSPAPEEAWAKYITPFATAIGRSPDEVTTALAPLVGQPGDEAIELLRSDADTPFESIRELLSGVATAKLRRAITTHLRAPVAAAPAAQPTVLATAFNVLPEVPNDDSWLKMLQTGGVLKVGKQTVIAAVRAGLGTRTNLFTLPDTLVKLMESTAESLDEPVSEEFFKLRKLLTRRRYSDIFQALEGEEGVDGRFITQARKERFVDKLDAELWPTLLEFQTLVKGWVEGWQTQMANPAMMMSAIASAVGGGGTGLPPGMMAPPPTDGLRDGASGVIDHVNRVFAGVGAPVAAALAFEAMKIREVLENPGLPALVGAQNREQMLKKCGAAVTADYVRLERGLTQYVLAVMDFPEVQASQELAYISALYQLGIQIPWGNLQAPARRSTLPRSSARSSANEE